MRSNPVDVRRHAVCNGIDVLTGLPNLSAFQTWSAQHRGTGLLAILLLDLDGLKALNRAISYAAGDRIMRVTAARLRRGAPANAPIFRLESDRFAVILSRSPEDGGLARAVGRILAALDRPCRFSGVDLRVGVSAGLALCAGRGGDGADLLDCATLALADAKRGGGGTCRLYAEEMRPVTRFPAVSPDELDRALERGEWTLHYQPQMSLPGRRLTGAEALLRWHHPTRGLLAPAAFIESLERHETVTAVGRWVLETACRDLAE